MKTENFAKNSPVSGTNAQEKVIGKIKFTNRNAEMIFLLLLVFPTRACALFSVLFELFSGWWLQHQGRTFLRREHRKLGVHSGGILKCSWEQAVNRNE